MGKPIFEMLRPIRIRRAHWVVPWFLAAKRRFRRS